MESLLTVKEVAAILGYSPLTVRRLIKSYDLPAIRLSRRAIRIERRAVEDFIAERAEQEAGVP